jgi:hypothetical protein
MSIVLSDNTVTVSLPYDLRWSDESWSPIEQWVERGLTGAQIVQVGIRQAGRPITLEPPPRGGWMQRSLLPQLQTWRDNPDTVLTLTLRGTAYAVRWRHHDPAGALTWEPLRHVAAPSAVDFVLPTLRFDTVS